VSYINKTLEKHKVVFVTNQLLETLSGSGNDILSQYRIQSERDTTGCMIVNGAVFLPVRRRTCLLGYFNPIKPKSISVKFRSTGSGKKTSPIWRGRCVSCGGDTAADGVSIDSG
jgi:hypothetical protein